MTSVRVNAKYTYSQGQDSLWLGIPKAVSNTSKDCFRYGTTANPTVVAPTVQVPAYGVGASGRTGNRINVTSIRMIFNLQLEPGWVNSLKWTAPYTLGTDYYKQVTFPAVNSAGWVNFRLFVVKFDDDVGITPSALQTWFRESFCYFRDKTSTAYNPEFEPVSAHSQVLRMTTQWTRNFNILFDKSFTVYYKDPSANIDVTVPLNKEFLFDDDLSSNILLSPNIYIFLLPPQNMEVDVDTFTREWLATNRPSTDTVNYFKLATVNYWAKLNYIDL